MTYPAFGVVFAQGVTGFSSVDPHQRRFTGDRNALWFFIIGVGASAAITVQNYMFASAAATLTAKLRSQSFRAILRQDSKFQHLSICLPA